MKHFNGDILLMEDKSKKHYIKLVNMSFATIDLTNKSNILILTSEHTDKLHLESMQDYLIKKEIYFKVAETCEGENKNHKTWRHLDCNTLGLVHDINWNRMIKDADFVIEI